MGNKTDFFVNHYFPFHFIVLGIFFILLGMLFILMATWLALLLWILGTIMISTHYRLRIDSEKGFYQSYLWILGMRRGTVKPISKLQYIYINKLRVKSGYGFVNRIDIQNKVFRGYIKLDNDFSLFIGQSKDETKLLRKCHRIGNLFSLEIIRNY